VDLHANTTVSDEYTATIWYEDYFQHWKNIQEKYEHLSNYNFTTENSAFFFYLVLHQLVSVFGWDAGSVF
jgi:hypothetical protein